jgi:hypothetical protein
MPIRAFAALLLLGAAVSAPVRAMAGTAGLKHERSIYADDGRRRLAAPEGVACADDGRLVVADTGNGRLVRYRWQEGALRGGEQIKLPELPYPARVQLGRDGSVLALDRKLRRIGRVDAKGGFAGYVDVPARPGSPAAMPVAFAVGPSGSVHVLDVAGRRLVVLDASGRVARDVALPRSGSFTDLALGGGGRVYAIDAVDATVWVVDEAGEAFRELAPGLSDRTRFPTDLASDGDGRLFVVDRHGDAIAVLGEDGSFRGLGLSGGQADGLLSYAAQLCVAQGHLFVADRGNNRVQVFSILR